MQIIRRIDLCAVIKSDPTVTDYGSQPEIFNFVDEAGHKRNYTPDFIVWRTNGEVEIHEITRSERRDAQSARQREKAARLVCESRGWSYHVHVKSDLPSKTKTANLLILHAYRPTIYFNIVIADYVFGQFVDAKPVNLRL